MNPRLNAGRLLKAALATAAIILTISFAIRLSETNAREPDGVVPEEVVYVIPVKTTIQPGLAKFVRRALAKAESSGAKPVIIEVDTLGGRIDAALDIRDAIISSPLETICFVQRRAWSAGALISMAGAKLVMAPGSSIGSAEPRPFDEKTLSAWLAELRGTAEKRGRDPEVAAAMADASISIPGITEKGRLLNLTAMQAKDIGFADAILDGIPQILNFFNISVQTREDTVKNTVIRIEPSNVERLSMFITHPSVAPALLAIGMAGLIIEVLTAGFGLPGLVGLVSLALFFGGSAIAGMSGWEAILLFIVGVILLMVEAFIPGFGVFGISGVVVLGFSIYLAAGSGVEAVRTLALSLIATIVLAGISFKVLRRRGFWNRIALSTRLDTEEGYVAPPLRAELLGKVGHAVTPLRPAGTIIINDERVDVVSDGSYVQTGDRVKVVRVEGARIVVRKMED